MKPGGKVDACKKGDMRCLMGKFIAKMKQPKVRPNPFTSQRANGFTYIMPANFGSTGLTFEKLLMAFIVDANVELAKKEGRISSRKQEIVLRHAIKSRLMMMFLRRIRDLLLSKPDRTTLRSRSGVFRSKP